MNRITSPRRSRAKWMTLAGVGAMALSLATAAQAQERPVGKVVGMPVSQMGVFAARNIFPGLDRNNRPLAQNNVNFLHLSQFAAGAFNTLIATVGVNQQNNSRPADFVYFPTDGQGRIPPAFTQINANDTFLQQQVIGVGNTAVAQVDVRQGNSGSYVPGATRWMLAPVAGVAPIQSANEQVNINNAHIQQTAIGANNTAVAVLGVDQNNAGNLEIPGQGLIGAMVNINTNVIVQTVVGEGNTAVATVNVNQQNSPVPGVGP
jgi:hypothetical protein